MNIIFTCDTLGSGGAERVISTLSNEFVKRGHLVSIVMLSKEARSPFYELDSKISLLYLGSKLRKNDGFLKKSRILRECLKEKNPDVVIAFLSYVCIYTWWALRNTKIPFIVSERNDPSQRPLIKQKLLNLAFKKAKGCVFQTEDSAKWYKNIGKNKSTIIYNPVKLNYDSTILKYAKQQILYVGRFSDQKNLCMLIDAFKIFKEKHPEYKLKMYGDGPNKQDIVSYINKLQMSNDVLICPSSKVWQKEEFNSKLFVLPSKFEGMPNALAEALCLGIPSVSTNCPIGGPKELKKIFKNSLILSKDMSSNEFALAMESGIKIENSNVKIPSELDQVSIATQWLKFINDKIEVENKNVR